MDQCDPARSTPAVSPDRRNGRRRLLAAIGAGAATGTLPMRWSTPLVESVILPAHAQTTGDARIEPPPPPVTVILDGVGALNQVTAVVYIDPHSGSASLSLVGPAEPDQLAALAVEDPGTGDFDTVSGISFMLLNGIDRVQDPGEPERFTASAELRHDPTGRIFKVSMQIRVDAAGTVYVLSAKVTGPI